VTATMTEAQGKYLNVYVVLALNLIARYSGVHEGCAV